MNILFCFNDAYLYPAINMMHSITRYTSEEVNFFILTTGLKKSSQNKLYKHAKKLKVPLSIQTIQLDSNKFKVHHYFTPDTYLRLFAIDVFKDIDKMLYLDVDMACLGDISKLYNVDLTNKLCAVVQDYSNNDEWNIAYKNNLKINHDYFNAGMIVMNLQEFRKSWSMDKIINLIKATNENLRLLDQDVLNIITTKDQLVFLPNKFNWQIIREELHPNENPVLIHYLGKYKPWKIVKLKKSEKLFWKEFRHTHCLTFYFIYLLNAIKYCSNKLLTSSKKKR